MLRLACQLQHAPSPLILVLTTGSPLAHLTQIMGVGKPDADVKTREQWCHEGVPWLVELSSLSSCACTCAYA